MTDTFSLLQALRRLEKGELLPSSDNFDLGPAAQRRKGVSEAAVSVPPRSIFRSQRAGQARVFPEDRETTSLLPYKREQLPHPVSTPPSRQPLVPADALASYSRLLDAEASRAQYETSCQVAELDVTLIRAQKLIPASFLKQYRLHEVLKRKALENMFLVCAKIRRDFKRDALLYWRQLSCELTFRLTTAAAISIGRLMRGYMARLKVKEAKYVSEKKVNEDIFARYGLQITRMQRWARRMVARLIRARRRTQMQQARILCLTEAAEHEDKILVAESTRWTGLRQDSNDRVRDVNYFRSKLYSSEEHRACRHIQAHSKRFLARSKLRRLRAKRHRDQQQARLDVPLQAQAVYFEHHGAALEIQRWFRGLPKHQLRVEERRDEIKFLIRVAKATLIQRIYRGFLGRRRSRNFRAIYSRAMLRKTKAVIKIQALFRRFRVRKRLTAAQNRRLKFKKRLNNFPDILDNKHRIRRRHSFSFPHFAIKSVEHLGVMELASRKIQRCWSSWKRRKRLLEFVQLVQNPAALKIARWLRSWILRLRMKSAAQAIQKQWGIKLSLLHRKRYAAVKLQSLYRRKAAIVTVGSYRKEVQKASARIVGWSRMQLFRQKKRADLAAHRQRFEMRHCGQYLYEKSVHCTIVDELWDATRKKKPNGPSELHKLFAMNSSNGTIDMGKTQKILRDCGRLVGSKSTDIDTQDVELVFTRVKTAGERKLEYIQFVDFLHELAILKYVSKVPLNVEVDETNFRYCRKRAKAALICKLIVDFVRKNSSFKLIEKELAADCAFARGRLKTIQNAKRIQLIARSFLARRKAAAMRNSRSAALESARRSKARTIIQRFGRSYLGRRFLVKLAQQMYVKCSDPDSKAPFWFNPRTGSSSWSKPKLLGDLDCGETIRLPAENERFTLMCSECDVTAASQFCDECDKAMCGPCVKLLHRAAAKQGHTQVIMDMCVECEFQVPTKLCLSCGDTYCDTCFQHVHRRGRLKLHTFQWLLKPCDICCIKAGPWCKANPGNAFQIVYMCTACYLDLNDGEQPQNNKNGVFVAEYRGPAIEMFRKRRDDDIARRKMESQNLERIKLMDEQKRVKAVVDIQRVYRGFISRMAHLEFVANRKLFFVLRELEMPVRRTFFYKLRDYFGTAPILSSDTPKERVLKMYPHFLYETVTDCFQGKWSVARRYLERLDRRKAAVEKEGTKIGGFGALMGLLRAQYKLKRAMRLMTKKENAHEMRRKQYREARSASIVNEVKKKRLQKLAHDELQNLENAKLKVEECEILLDESRIQWEIIAGPRGIQRMVSEQRQRGVLLPFTVSLIKGCRFAHVSALTSAAGGRSPVLNADGVVSWSKYLKHGDTVQIHGSYFRVISGDELLSAYDDSNEVESERIDLNREESDHDDESSDSGNEKGVNVAPFECKKVVREIDGVLMPRRTEEFVPVDAQDCFIKLNRLWVLESCSNLEIRKVTKKPLHTRIPFSLSQYARDTIPVQVSVVCIVLFLSKLSRFLSAAGNFIGDEGEIGAFLNAMSVDVIDAQNSVLKASSSVINTSNHGYTIRMITKIIKSIGRASVAGFNHLAEEYRKYKENIVLDPFEIWDTSDDKTEITCFLESESGSRDLIGTFLMDLDAPCSVMRLYLKRHFREQLNEVTGDSFLFFGIVEDSETILDRDVEENTESRQYVELRIDDDTESRHYKVLIMRDKSAELVLIPEFTHDTSNKHLAEHVDEPVLDEKVSAHYM